MRTRDKVSLALAPVFLRLMLAAVFIWAGLGKLKAIDTVDAESAAILANMGVLSPSSPAPADPAAPSVPLPTVPKEDAPPKPADKPTNAPAEKPADKPVEKPVEKPAGGLSRSRSPLGGVLALATLTPAGTPPVTSVPATTPRPVYTAKDFASGASVRRVHMIALGIHHAANPAAAADGSPVKPTWPRQLAEGRRPVYVAWAVAVGELGCGALVLLGLLTRVGALGIAFIMLGAMWLTQFGPAIASGKATLGFLPNHSAFSADWMTLTIQFTLLLASLSLFFAGPGLLAIDNALFARSHKTEDHDGE